MKAPSFTLNDQDGKPHSSEEYKGKWVVVYFYPKDDTPGCTIEACSFRDNISELTKKDIIVFGISKDSVKSHKKFADKFKLPFPLLSDPELTTIKAFGAWGKKKFMGREFDGILRKTYIINPAGEIVKTYEKVEVNEHAQEILQDIKQLSS